MKLITLFLSLMFSQIVMAECKVYVPDTKDGDKIFQSASRIYSDIERTLNPKMARVGVKRQDLVESDINLIGQETIKTFVSFEIFKDGQLDQATEPRMIAAGMDDIPQGVGAAIARLCSDLVHIN